MTRVLSFLNLQKGGGKTTTVLNLAAALANHGYNTLAVDLDPDAALEHRLRSAHLVTPDPNGATGIVRTREGWHLLPAPNAIAALHARVLYRVVRHARFEDELRVLFDGYDCVLVDGSTHESLVLAEALALTDTVVIPLDSESLQFLDAVERLANLQRTAAPENPALQFGGVWLARYSPRLRRAREMLTELSRALGSIHCFSSYLADCPEIREAEKRGGSVLTHAPRSHASNVFHALARELVEYDPVGVTDGRSAADGIVHLPPTVAPGTAALAPGVVPAGEFMLPALDLAHTWLSMARAAGDASQALRYATLALEQEPGSVDALECFENCLTEQLTAARSDRVSALVGLGEFLADHSFEHYAAQLFRRAADLNPICTPAWAGAARTASSAAEREYALEMCLQLNEQLDAAYQAQRLPARRGRARPAYSNVFLRSAPRLQSTRA